MSQWKLYVRRLQVNPSFHLHQEFPPPPGHLVLLVDPAISNHNYTILCTRS